MIAGVIGEMKVVAAFAGKEAPAQSRGAAMSDGPDGAALRRRKRRIGGEELRQKAAQRPQNGGALRHAEAGKELWVLARQPFAELVHEAQGVLGALMSQMQIDHGAGDLLMTEQFLNRVQMRAGFQQMRGETVPQ